MWFLYVELTILLLVSFAGGCAVAALLVRLIVRRVRPTPGTQLALFTTWSYHAFVTDRPGPMLELEADLEPGIHALVHPHGGAVGEELGGTLMLRTSSSGSDIQVEVPHAR